MSRPKPCSSQIMTLSLITKCDHYPMQGDGNSTGPPGQYPQGFCWKGQPIWSQYRESSFGHGTLDLLNSTHALW